MSAVDASITGKSNVLRTRIEELTTRERGLLDALQQVRASLTESRQQLADAEAAKARAQRPPGVGGPGARVAEATWRRVVRELGTFTVSELATELGTTKQTAKKHLRSMLDMGLVAPAGRALGKSLFEYQRPEGEGEAFKAQQRHLEAVPVVETITVTRGGAVEGTGRGITVANKDVRQACEEAERRGWKLRKKGDGHYVLVKGSRRVPVAGSPKSGTDSADIIRRMTRER